MNLTTLILVSTTEFIIFYQFLSNFFDRKSKSNLYKIMTSAIIIALLTVINLLEVLPLNTIAAIILLYAYTEILFEGRSLSKFLMTVFIITLGIVAEFAAGFGVSLCFNTNLTETIQIPLYVLAIYIVSKGILFVITRTIIYLYPQKHYSSLDRRTIWLVLLPIFGIINMYLLMYLEFHGQPSSTELLVSTIVGVGLIFSGIITFMVYDSSMNNRELENKLIIAEHRHQANEALSRQQERDVEETRKIIHDFKNQLLSLNELYNAGDVSARKYHHDLMTSLESQEKMQTIDMHNAVISNIIKKTQLMCAHSNITFSVQIEYDDLSFLDYMDANTIFNNAMDNALLACRQMPSEAHKYITLKIFTAGHFLVVKIENSKNNPIKEMNGHIKSSKQDQGQHGFGIDNVRHVAEKYGGDATFEYDENTFILLIRMNSIHNNNP